MPIKSLLLLFIFPFFLAAPPEKVMDWRSPTDHEFGDIKQGVPVTFEFKFQNLTDAPLTIDAVRTTCGCTASDWSEIPTEPKAVGSVPITFDARKTGYFYKKIKVFFHGQRKGELLTISGYVEP